VRIEKAPEMNQGTLKNGAEGRIYQFGNDFNKILI
jgi:hypothetical protein